MSFNWQTQIRNQFLALNQEVRGKRLVYLDSAATTLKPQSVMDTITRFYSFETANVHRGAHFLSDNATAKFEKSRQAIANFLGTDNADEIVFVKGTTDALNLIAFSLGEIAVQAGDEILLTEMEHHANLVPWQMLAQRKNAVLKFVEVLPNGELSFDDFRKKLSAKTKVFAFTACSNTLGTVNDIALFTQEAHNVGAKVVVDGAQYVTYDQCRVKDWGCDFFVFSSHKLFGPFGFGALYGKKSLLDQMPPYQGGGSMISQVELQQSTYNVAPFRFEAGTPHVEGAIGTHAAIDYQNSLSWPAIREYKNSLTTYALQSLKNLEFVDVYGQAAKRAAIFSFNVKGAHHSDVSQILDQQGIAVRAGHHCTQPLMKRFNITGSVRASLSIYNTKEDIDALVQGLIKARGMLL